MELFRRLSLSLPVSALVMLMTASVALAESSESMKELQAAREEVITSQGTPVEVQSSDNTITRRPSRLSQLIRQPVQLYMPTRLVLGEENTLVVRGKAGQQVIVYISPDNQGYTLDNGMALRVSSNHEQFKGTIPENGILNLVIPFPDEPELRGKIAFIDAVVWSRSDLSDMQQVELVGSDGRRADENKLVFMKQGDGKGTMFMPTLPGMSPQLMQTIGTLSQIQQGDERKKQLLDDGTIYRDQDIREQNSFIQRPGMFGTAPR